MNKSKYSPIGDYAFIADCHASALISKDGSIDWCCMPRFDSGSIFGRLLDWRRGGYCWIRPQGVRSVSREYLGNSLILKTTFTTDGSQIHLIDLLPVNTGENPSQREILRIVEAIEGTTDILFTIAPVFDYSATRPWIRKPGDYFSAIGGNDGLLISSNIPLLMKHLHYLVSKFTLKRGSVHICQSSGNVRRNSNQVPKNHHCQKSWIKSLKTPKTGGLNGVSRARSTDLFQGICFDLQ